MTRPGCLLFDVNETLLDLTPLKQSVAAALGDRAELVGRWFTSLLHHSLVTSAAGRYESFDIIGAAVLRMLARGEGMELSASACRAALTPMTSLDPHPDVRPALEQLRREGHRLVALTNSASDALNAQLDNAGLTDLFEARFSVEEVQLYKPHAHVYRWAARRLGLTPGDCMMVAAHGWDVAGAQWAGLRAAFIARPGAVLYPLGPTPELVVPDLRHLPPHLEN